MIDYINTRLKRGANPMDVELRKSDDTAFSRATLHFADETGIVVTYPGGSDAVFTYPWSSIYGMQLPKSR